MRRVRLSIVHLLVLVFFCAIAFAALRAVSEPWANGLFTLAVGTLLFALLGILYGRPSRKAFWVGFSIFGWGYLLLGLVPDARPWLATTTLFGWLHDRIGGNDRDQVISATFAYGGVPWVSPHQQAPIQILWDPGSGRFMDTLALHRDLFQRIGHTLSTLLLALIGGLVAQRLASGREPGRREPAATKEGQGTRETV